MEKRVKQLKRSLEGWREIVLLLHSVLIWEQQWHVGALVGVITTEFLLVWWLDPTILTLFSVLGLTAVLVDYLVPLVASNFFRSENWDGAKEKKFEQICKILASSESTVCNVWSSFYAWRESRPKLYLVTVITTLLVTSYLGSIINNLFLTYLIVVLISVIPGLRHRGLIQKYFGQVMGMVEGMLKKGGEEKKSN
ncbi:ADP-ribosylation factor-like protein 6-interacting protein 1 isoform X2 [Neocloeon triangulifer]|uniref:ADP-ribosylation factor-like protein 6-interacting protein 1 isoform X2 n=1 Tax=Neocloeon triangulifer TaxID=2078957 RepID=UPI00286EB8A9|nr:ADP-ribosylation factor-like protein 6-interacting protein 1 isoform X2 [Neocloeon triangulifer]